MIRSQYRSKATRRKETINTVSWVITIGIFLPLIILKLVIWIIKIFFSIIVDIVSLFKKSEHSNKEKETANLKTTYDDLFKRNIVERGVQYFRNNKVSDYKFENQICTARIKGTNDYVSSITFLKNGEINNATCSCPYFQKENTYCKHIYALLLKYCDEENKDGLNIKQNNSNSKTGTSNKKNSYSRQLINICNSMNNILTNAKRVYNSCKFKDDIDVINNFEKIISYKDKIFNYKNLRLIDINEKTIEIAKSDYIELKTSYENLIDKIKRLKSQMKF